jgi:hypothetical protein
MMEKVQTLRVKYSGTVGIELSCSLKQGSCSPIPGLHNVTVLLQVRLPAQSFVHAHENINTVFLFWAH